jgi:cell division topological specificity factor
MNAIIESIKKLFNREPSSKEVAKERLKLVLIHDRTSISPEIMNEIRGEIIGVISKHLEVDMNGIDISLEGEENSVALIASIPIKGLKRYNKKKKSQH